MIWMKANFLTSNMCFVISCSIVVKEPDHVQPATVATKLPNKVSVCSLHSAFQKYRSQRKKMHRVG